MPSPTARTASKDQEMLAAAADGHHLQLAVHRNRRRLLLLASSGALRRDSAALNFRTQGWHLRKHNPWYLACASGDVDNFRCWLFCGHDAIGPVAASFRTPGRATGRIRRSICALARLLAADISAGRLGWIICGDFANLADACRPDVRSSSNRVEALAGDRCRRHST